eukprot:1160232-Pelagomonas_calceolata.AAC.2
MSNNCQPLASPVAIVSMPSQPHSPVQPSETHVDVQTGSSMHQMRQLSCGHAYVVAAALTGLQAAQGVQAVEFAAAAAAAVRAALAAESGSWGWMAVTGARGAVVAAAPAGEMLLLGEQLASAAPYTGVHKAQLSQAMGEVGNLLTDAGAGRGMDRLSVGGEAAP